jgi:Zn-dependent peptidase ImmA (M78 family)
MTDSRALAAARAVAPLVSSDRLVLARELTGWTQREVVDRLDRPLSAAALSQLETGRTRPAPETLAALADFYGCPPAFFVERPEDEARPGFFRSLKALPARERRKRIANARLLASFVAVLEEHVVLPDNELPRYPRDPLDLDAVEQVAAQVRSDWEVPDGPVDDVVRLLERNGLIVVRSQQRRTDVDAFSVRFPQRSVVVLGSDKAVASRSRFDAAHELGHLVMHADAEAGTSAVEKHAHAFASAFLMPADDIIDSLPRKVDLSVLMELKAEWRVSMSAILMRSKTLGVMAPTTYVSAMKMFSSRGWRRTEPGDHLLGAIETPVLLERALDAVHKADNLTVADLCAEGDLPFEHVQAVLARTRDRRARIDL